MINPRPAYRFMLIETPSDGDVPLFLSPTLPTASFSSVRMIRGRLLVLKSGQGGPPQALNLWRNGRRGFTLLEWMEIGNPVPVYQLRNAWPCKWELSEFDAAKNEVAIETIEFVHEGLS